jgi:hypothetical protein
MQGLGNRDQGIGQQKESFVANPEELFRRAHAAMENYEGFKLFFKAVELWINQEIDIENARFGQAEICGATKAARAGLFAGEPLLEIQCGPRRTGFVRLNMLDDVIEVEIDDRETHPLPFRRDTRFRLENQESGAKAFMIGTVDGSTAETEMGPREIAQVVVAGVVRGYFA